MKEMRVSIVTPEGVIFDGNALAITLPGIDGEFGVYPNHCALLSLLRAGVIELIHEDQSKDYVAIDWGYVKVEDNQVDVLANGAVPLVEGGAMAEAIERARELFKRAASDDLFISSALSRFEYLARRQ